MKKLLLLASAIVLINNASAQTTTPTPNGGIQTPNTITNRFSTDYPNMNATWTMDGKNYRAEYMDNSRWHSVTYDANGKMTNREEQLTMGNYPSAIGDYYTKNYPNEKYEVWSSTDGDGKTSYFTNRNSETLWFDNSGKYKNKSKAKERKVNTGK